MIRCDVCDGRGWVPGKEWADQCGFCGGRGNFTCYALAKKLDEHPRTLENLRDMRTRSRFVAERIFNKLVAVLP